jgi:hypothetical protein
LSIKVSALFAGMNQNSPAHDDLLVQCAHAICFDTIPQQPELLLPGLGRIVNQGNPDLRPNFDELRPYNAAENAAVCLSWNMNSQFVSFFTQKIPVGLFGHMAFPFREQAGANGARCDVGWWMGRKPGGGEPYALCFARKRIQTA